MTMDDIARLANVSKPTVSRALKDSPLVNPTTKEHVRSIAQAHGYAVNRNAQNLRHQRTNTVAVSLDYRSHKKNHISDPFIFDLLAGVSEALGDRNQDLLLSAPTHNDAAFIRNLISSRVADGVVLLGQGHREEMLGELHRSGVPIVVWGAGSSHTDYCVVGSDNFRGGQLVGEYFLHRGRRRFVFAGDVSFREIYLRCAGLEQVAEQHPGKISMQTLPIRHFSYESAFSTAARFLTETQTPPDAIFAYSDTAAMAFINACRERGLGVPQDVSIVGYNDLAVTSYFNPAITTIRQDAYEAGKCLVVNLMDILAGQAPTKPTLIPTELIVRGT